MVSYPAKILLFGEYAVLFGAPAFAIPFSGYSGQFTRESTSDDLRRFVQHIMHQKNDAGFFDFLDTAQMLEDLEQGLNFKSDIPAGYGLGSSGALCAALLDRYGLDWDRSDIEQTHYRLQQLEHYFHGESSGLDPLVSFYGQAAYQTGRGTVRMLDSFEWNSPMGLWLLNMEQSRKTAPLVDWFHQQMNHPGFEHSLRTSYVPLVEKLCLQLAEGLPLAPEHIKRISRFQWNLLRPLIPRDLRGDWLRGLKDDQWIIKLCGAGGGGMMLLFAPEAFESDLLDWPLIPVFSPS